MVVVVDLIKHQILVTDLKRNVQQPEGRINSQIIGNERLNLPNRGGLDASVIILYVFPSSSSSSLTWPFYGNNTLLIFIFSILFSLICYGTDKENLFDNQELLNLMILSFIFITFAFYSRVKMQGEVQRKTLNG